jgi:hypothetical protein
VVFGFQSLFIFQNMVFTGILIVLLICASFVVQVLYLRKYSINGLTNSKVSVNPSFLEMPKNAIEFVFECEGVRYYKFANETNMPIDRAMSALDVYAEMDLKVDREFLASHCKAVDNAVNAGKLKDIVLLNQILQRKMEAITNIDLMYKLASVLYFCESENPNVYDYSLAQKKIQSWKSQKDVHAFFLQMPIKDLLPSFNTSDMNLQLYTLLQRKEHLTALQYHLSLLLPNDIESEHKKELETQISQLASLIQSDI